MSYARRVCFKFFTHEDFCVYPALVQYVSVAIAGARGNPASVAHAAEVHDLAAVCHVVASRAARAVPSAHTACICYISSAVALARGDARAAAHLCVCVCVRERESEKAKDDYKCNQRCIESDCSISDHEQACVLTSTFCTTFLMVSQGFTHYGLRDLKTPLP